MRNCEINEQTGLARDRGTDFSAKFAVFQSFCILRGGN
jgi:hypothetical protein